MELGVMIDEQARRYAATPEFAASYDIVVVGLGTAGAEAFVRSVERGRTCLGIEKTGGMGGQATVGCICWGDGIVKALEGYERRAARADLAYESAAIGVWLDKGRIVGLRYVTNGLVRDVAAKIVIDASGNATVAKMCGLPVRRGRDFDGVMATCARGETWANRETNATRPTYGGRPFGLACPSAEYSRYVCELSRLRHTNWKNQTKNERMLRASSLVNAREEERVVTEEIVTLKDALTERKFPNPIFYAWEPEDLPVYYDDHAFESDEIQDWKVLCGLPMFGYPSVIPYGTIVAKGLEGLFVPSKHFGVAHDLGGGLRMQGEMRKTGIVAAIAADLALKEGCALKDLPYARLEPEIRKAGTLTPSRKAYVTTYRGYAFTPYTDDQAITALKQDIVRTDEWWQAKGASTNSSADQAAYALWTCWSRRLTGTDAQRRALADRLAAEMATAGRFAVNFAVALGLMDDCRAVPVLREIVRHPGGATDPVVVNAYPNRVKAILLLGRFRDREIVPTLRELVLDNAETFMKDLYSKRAFLSPQRCRFQALSYALMALKAILSVHPDPATARAIADWQKKPLEMIEREGVDLADRLRHVRVGW